MKKENNLPTVKKHNALIQSRAPHLTALQRKVFNYLLHVAQKKGEQDFYEAPLADIQILCKASPKMTSYSLIQKRIKGLMDVNVEFNYCDRVEGEIWEASVLIASVQVKHERGMVRFEIPKALREKFLKPSQYTPLDIFRVAKLKSKYSIILYEYLKSFLTAPSVPVLEIKEYRELMSVPKEKYSLFRDFRIYVIEFPVKEINEKTELDCSFELVRASRRNRYESIKFQVGKKKDFLPPQEELEETSLFDDLLPFGRLTPEEIKKYIPFQFQDKITYRIINTYKCPPNQNSEEILLSNLKYVKLHAKSNYHSYLKLSLESDYAKEDREIEKIKVEKAEKVKAIEQARQRTEDARLKAKTEQEKKDEELIKSLSKEEYDSLSAIAEKTVKNSEFVRSLKPDTIKNLIEIEMIRLKRSEMKEKK